MEQKNASLFKWFMIAIFIIASVFIVISFIFGVVMLIRKFTNDSISDCGSLYEISIAFSTLGFGIATLAISLISYKRKKNKTTMDEEQLIVNCREKYSEIISTHEFRFVKEIFDTISSEYSLYTNISFLDDIEKSVISFITNFSEQTLFINTIKKCLYLLPNEKIGKKNGESLNIALVTITASSIRSLLAKFSTITSFYMNGHLSDENFEYNFLDGILSVHLMAVIIQNLFAFYCQNAKVRSDLNTYFINTTKIALKRNEKK